MLHLRAQALAHVGEGVARARDAGVGAQAAEVAHLGTDRAREGEVAGLEHGLREDDVAGDALVGGLLDQDVAEVLDRGRALGRVDARREGAPARVEAARHGVGRREGLCHDRRGGGGNGARPRGDGVPGHALGPPAGLDERVVLEPARGVVVGASHGEGVVLAKQRHALLVVGVPADALVGPADLDQCVTLGLAHGVVMVARIAVVEAVHRRARALGCDPANALEHPAHARDHVALEL